MVLYLARCARVLPFPVANHTGHCRANHKGLSTMAKAAALKIEACYDAEAAELFDSV